MKLKHLNYIQSLLWNEEFLRHRMYEEANGAYLTSEEFDLDDLEEARQLRDAMLERWTVAKEALELFEAREWW